MWVENRTIYKSEYLLSKNTEKNIKKMNEEKIKAIDEQILIVKNITNKLQLTSMWRCIICTKYGFSVGHINDISKEINGKWGQCDVCYGLCCQQCFLKCFDKNSKSNVIACKECIKISQ